ncbi:MAG: hypothetical protein VKL41_08660 [Snowella sp.]|jgi:hypothetical protein|nr:hypothetical protein [Snowella sp.]
MKKSRRIRIVVASLLAMGSILGTVALGLSQECKTDEKIWNQQIQSSSNFGSIIVQRCK